MPWFKVDDTFHSHPKVLACSPAAIGLWVIAGSWSAANLTEGHIPGHVLPRLVTSAAKRRANELVSAGLWMKSEDGYAFKDWSEYQPSKESVEAQRQANAERQKRWREARKGKKSGASNGESNGVTPPSTNGVTNASLRRHRNASPSRPDRETTSLSAHANDPTTPQADTETRNRPEDGAGEREETNSTHALVLDATDARPDEVEPLLEHVRVTLRPRGRGLLRTIAANGDLQSLLNDVRAHASTPRVSPRDEWLLRQ